MKLPPSETQLCSLLKSLVIAEISIFIIYLGLAISSGIMTGEISGSSTDPTRSDMILGLFWLFFLVVGLPAMITSWYGILRFRWWSRWLYVSSYILVKLFTLPFELLDFSVTWGLLNWVADLGSVVSGVMIAIMFLTSVSSRFEKSEHLYVNPDEASNHEEQLTPSSSRMLLPPLDPVSDKLNLIDHGATGKISTTKKQSSSTCPVCSKAISWRNTNWQSKTVCFGCGTRLDVLNSGFLSGHFFRAGSAMVIGLGMLLHNGWNEIEIWRLVTGTALLVFGGIVLTINFLTPYDTKVTVWKK